MQWIRLWRTRIHLQYWLLIGIDDLHFSLPGVKFSSIVPVVQNHFFQFCFQLVNMAGRTIGSKTAVYRSSIDIPSVRSAVFDVTRAILNSISLTKIIYHLRVRVRVHGAEWSRLEVIEQEPHESKEQNFGMLEYRHRNVNRLVVVCFGR